MIDPGTPRSTRAWTLTMLGADPVDALAESDEPYAAWATLTGVLGRRPDDSEVASARIRVLGDPNVKELVDELPSWGEDIAVSGHHSPKFLPNRLNLLADMGVSAGDFARIEAILDAMLEHQDNRGRFQSFGQAPGRPKPEWGSLLCDTNVVVDIMLRFGRGSDERVVRAIERMRADLANTPQGRAWQCVPERRSLFRGPGRKADVCPQVTLEGLRAFSQVYTVGSRPDWLLDAARTPLEVWRRRTGERPYEFGHGYQFKSVKWPNFWYDVLWVLETVGRYPELWTTEGSEEDRSAVTEIAACLVAYNFDDGGMVTPKRVYRGFEHFSFGQKKVPSPFATARCLTALRRVSELAAGIAAVDVDALPSSKGGSGTPVPPRRSAPACPTPTRLPAFSADAAINRPLARHHLTATWEPASIDTLVGDVIGIQATHVATPYLSLAERLDGFAKTDLDRSLYDRHATVKMRTMRGMLYVIRADSLPWLFAATSRPVIRYARTHAEFRGIDDATYERLAAEIVALLAAGPLTTTQMRERLGTRSDVAAVVTLMCAEGLLLRDRPVGTWLDRRNTYSRTDLVLPGMRLDAIDEATADIALVRAHIRAFAPVVPEDTAWWTGLGRQRTLRALDTLGDEIVRVSVSGFERAMLVHAADLDELAVASRPPGTTTLLLPWLDPLVMGYAKRGRFIARPEHRDKVFDPSGRVTSLVLVNGRIVGVWDVETAPEPAVLVHLFTPPTPEIESAIRDRAAGVGRLWHDEEVPVRFVAGMAPLATRSASSVFKPLRAGDPRRGS